MLRMHAAVAKKTEDGNRPQPILESLMATSPRAASVSSSQPRRRIKADVTEKAAAESPYHLRISRLTVDKLGVKLYDKASAVVAELIANGYDADAETVTVRLPLGIQLASKAGGQLKDDRHGCIHNQRPNQERHFGRRWPTYVRWNAR
ncbi:hypothetical protein [Ralstonia pseudosolanacearum]|uniref:ATP-binding protein n=1 Tax=Ralstonia solanacearum TaxID=305 RepID=A0ABY6N8M8_RALSL|nr:hypothetical protein LH706_10460 [Ralstonia solanacearum]